jgi:tetratricopeptide (TPR) repeat protein/4-amino-4-deoxy-L-arabinose transferase-like glycosyltransferase
MKKIFKPEYALALLCMCFLAAGFISLNTMVVYNPDSSRYLVWANSLAKFSGYEDTSGPEISRYVVHAPLYSLALAPSQMICSGSIAAAKTETLFFGVAVLLLLFFWLKEKTSGWYAFFGCALLATNPSMFFYSTQVLSEAPFLACLLLFFIVSEKAVQKPEEDLKTTGLYISAVLLCVFMREIGMALLFAAVFFLVLQKQNKRAMIVFGAAAVFYILWFIRNEILIASFENPVLRNSRIFLGHSYTANDASMLTEFAVRFVSNCKVYGEILWRAVYFPDFFNHSNVFIMQNDPVIIAVKKILPFLGPVMACCTVGTAGVGIWRAQKSARLLSLLSIVTVCFVIPVLFYPVNDQRFLFPLLVVLLLLMVLGLKYFLDRLKESARFHKLALPFCLCLAAGWILPQAAWIENYVSGNYNFGRSPKAFSERIIQKKQYPEIFSRPLSVAGEWIASNSDSSAIILSRWKELTFSLNGKKMIETDIDILPDIFDRILRDYHVRYLVSVVMTGGIGEFDALMSQSHCFHFQQVYRAGMVEVFEIREKNGGETSIEYDSVYCGVLRKRFSAARQSLETDPRASFDEFSRLKQEYGPFGYYVFEMSVAKEFMGQMDSAAIGLESFRYAQQAGSYIHQGWYHHEIISRLKAAGLAETPYDRANGYYIVAANYWEMGYRLQALKTLQISVKEDSTFFPAFIFQSVFSLENGDTLAARGYYKTAAALSAGNVLITNLKDVWTAFDSLHLAVSKDVVLRQHARIITAYLTTGINEKAIDEYLAVLKTDSGNIEALSGLASLYERKQRWYPAYQCYKKLSCIETQNIEWKNKCEELGKRL